MFENLHIFKDRGDGVCVYHVGWAGICGCSKDNDIHVKEKPPVVEGQREEDRTVPGKVQDNNTI